MTDSVVKLSRITTEELHRIPVFTDCKLWYLVYYREFWWKWVKRCNLSTDYKWCNSI